jgi:hypothetical protein
MPVPNSRPTIGYLSLLQICTPAIQPELLETNRRSFLHTAAAAERIGDDILTGCASVFVLVRTYIKLPALLLDGPDAVKHSINASFYITTCEAGID